MAKDKNIEEGIGSSDDQEVSSASSANGESSNRNNRGKRRVREDDIDEPIAPKKAKIVWTNPLHNRFLLALHHLGLDKAVPKKILEFMNVPGLTRENVASHLQKYRMFLKKVAEKGLWQSHAMSEKLLRSSFATGYNPHRNALSFPSITGYGGSSATLGLSRYSNFTHEASSSTAPPPFRHGQSSLLAGHCQNPMIGNYGHQTPARLGMPRNGLPTTPLSMFQPNRTVGSNFGNPDFSSLNSGNGGSYNSTSSFAGIRLNGNQLDAGQMGAPFGADSAANPNFGYGWNGQNPNPNLTGNSSGAGSSFTGNRMSGFVPNNAGFGSSSSAFGEFLGQGGPSSSSYSSLFGSGANNPTSMAFNGSNDQGLAAIFNHIPKRNAHAGNSGGNEFPFSLLNDVSGPGSSSDSQHVELDDHDLDLFFGSAHFQQQNGGNAMNFDGSFQNEINTNDFLNTEFSNSCSLVDKAPWTQQSSPESGEGTVNANNGSNSNSMDSNNNSVDSFFLQNAEGSGNANTGSSSNSMDSFFHQSQSSSPEEPMPSDLNLTGQSASPPSDENQSFGDDLLDMLLSNHPF